MVSVKEMAKELVGKMTLEEKAGLCSGRDCWTMRPIERLGLESIMMSDGPHGLRKQISVKDNLGIGDSVPSVCFPTASALACSFDRDLAYEVGKALGEECLQEEVAILLGPGVNQKRSPLCGRNFEYFSEDPLLSGEMAVGMIKGVQSMGVGTSLKHFAVNNQEKRRMTVSAVVDERALRETYLKAFEIAVKKGKPATVMCAYNRLNGEYCSENSYLLSDILRKEWGFDGVVLSDWGAVNDRVLGLKAGLDIEMPGSQGINDKKIVKAVRDKELSEEVLDKAVCRITELILEGMDNRRKGFLYDVEAHHQLAVKAEQESAVLLKNEDRILPGNLRQKVAIIGAFAKNPRYQGAGSSKLHPIQVDNTYEVLHNLGMDITYSKGYDIKQVKQGEAPGNRELVMQDIWLKEACDAVIGKDIVYLFAGLPEGYESEGFDRSDLNLPPEQNRLIESVAECNKNVVVILIGGAPMELPWIHQVKGVLLAYLGGEGCGTAIANLLLGYAVPCGKLAETWPLSLQDTPAYHYFPGGRATVEYRESIYVGYRYYEKAGKEVLFPFGYGLSYTNFHYSDLKLEREDYEYGDRITLSFQLTNKGRVAAKETAFIYVAHQSNTVFLPIKELREFVKVSLEPGETKELKIELDTLNFGYYNTIIKDWYAEEGIYTIMVGESSKECNLQTSLRLNNSVKPQPALKGVAAAYYRLPDGELRLPEADYEALYGKRLPESDHKPTRPYHANHTLEDVSHTLIGKLIFWIADLAAKKVTHSSKEQEGMMSATIKEMPFHAMVTSGDGMITEHMLEGILDLLNGHYGKGILKLMKRKVRKEF